MVLIETEMRLKIGEGFDRLRILITGEKSCGKTSFLFKMAYDDASKGGHPLYICNKNKMEASLPLIVKTPNDQAYYNLSSEVLIRISMKYVSSVTELKALIAGLHSFEPRPTSVMIDDFTLFIDPLFSVSRHDSKFIDSCITLTAYLTDVINFFERQRAADITADALQVAGGTGPVVSNRESNEVKLVIADVCQDPIFLNVMRRCVSHVFLLQKLTPGTAQLVWKPRSAVGVAQQNLQHQIRGGISSSVVCNINNNDGSVEGNGDVVVFGSIQLQGKCILVS